MRLCHTGRSTRTRTRVQVYYVGGSSGDVTPPPRELLVMTGANGKGGTAVCERSCTYSCATNTVLSNQFVYVLITLLTLYIFKLFTMLLLTPYPSW